MNIQELKEKSSQRVDPKCSVATQCGGCQLQHQSYASQLTFKESLLQERLSRFISIETNTIKPILHASIPFSFRNKIQLSFAYGTQKSELAIGMYASRSHRVVDMEYCPIISDHMNAILPKFRNFYRQFPISIFDEHTGQGCLRHLTIRSSHHTHDIMILLTIGEPLPHQEMLISFLTP